MSKDRRIRKTEKSLRDALVSLMKEKPLSKITVKELVERADVNRATFYLHYPDVLALYETIEAELLGELKKCYIPDSTHSYVTLIENIVYHIYDNRDIYVIFIGENADLHFNSKVCNLLQGFSEDVVKYEKHSDVLTDAEKYEITHEMAGYVAIIERWGRENFIFEPEKIVGLIRQISVSLANISDWN